MNKTITDLVQRRRTMEDGLEVPLALARAHLQVRIEDGAARTEQYWCPIKHARKLAAAHPRSAAFVDYGDATAWREETAELRRTLRE